MADAAITMYGAEWCGDCRRSKRLLDSLGVAYDYIDVANDDAGKDVAIEISGKMSIPVISPRLRGSCALLRRWHFPTFPPRARRLSSSPCTS